MNDDSVMCNVFMLKNIEEIFNVFLNEEIEDEEEEKKEPVKPISPLKDFAFKPSKIIPVLLKVEEKL